MARRPFTDNAGFTCHCWECRHAKGWTPNVFMGPFARCELTGYTVKKYDSPNNQCSRVGIECRYESEREDA